MFARAVGDGLVADRLGRLLLLFFRFRRLDRRGHGGGAARRRRARRRRNAAAARTASSGVDGAAASRNDDGGAIGTRVRREATGARRAAAPAALARTPAASLRASAPARAPATAPVRLPDAAVLSADRPAGAAHAARLDRHRQRGRQPAGADRDDRRAGVVGAEQARFGRRGSASPFAFQQHRVRFADREVRLDEVADVFGREELNVYSGRIAVAQAGADAVGGDRDVEAGFGCLLLRCASRRPARGRRASPANRRPGCGAAARRLGFEREFADVGISRAVTGATVVRRVRCGGRSTWASRKPLAPMKSGVRTGAESDVAERARAEGRDRLAAVRAAAA